MKKGIVLGIVFLFVFMSFTSISGVHINNQIIKSSGRGNILYVGGSGPSNYSKIQDAIDNASIGDTVFVFDDYSPYFEDVTVDKSLQLIGENKDTTIIDAQNKESVVNITGDQVTVRGFNLQNSGDEFYNGGVEIRSDNNSVTENIIIFNKNGVSIKDGNENTVSKNIIRNNTEGEHPNIYYGGIFIKKSNYNLITENIIENNDYPGLVLWEAKENEIKRNIIAYNNGSGIDLWGWAMSNERNIISGNILRNNMGSGIDVDYGSNNDISFNNFEDDSINLFCSENMLIYKNNFFNSYATFDYVLGEQPNNKWNQNYWNKPRTYPKIIIGWVGQFSGWDYWPLFRWFDIDYFPADEPHDIYSKQNYDIDDNFRTKDKPFFGQFPILERLLIFLIK